MNRVQRLRVEAVLLNYYQQQAGQARLQAAREATERQIAVVRRSLADTSELIPSFGVTGSGSTARRSAGTVADPTAAAYEAYRRALADLEGELARLLRRQVHQQLRLGRLLAAGAGVEFALSHLGPADRELLEQKYLYGRSNFSLGLALGVDESTVRHRRQGVLVKVAEWLGRG